MAHAQAERKDGSAIKIGQSPEHAIGKAGLVSSINPWAGVTR